MSVFFFFINTTSVLSSTWILQGRSTPRIMLFRMELCSAVGAAARGEEDCARVVKGAASAVGSA